MEAFVYFGLLAGNALVALVCLIAGPRTWARRLCATFLWVNGLGLLTVAAYLIRFALTTNLQSEGGFGLGLAIMITMPVAIEFLILLGISFSRLRPQAHPPPGQE